MIGAIFRLNPEHFASGNDTCFRSARPMKAPGQEHRSPVYGVNGPCPVHTVPHYSQPVLIALRQMTYKETATVPIMLLRILSVAWPQACRL
jgi:hypothetical protein